MTDLARQAGAGRCVAVMGLQWGDEGKGKIVDLMAPQHDAVVRFNGGANAGHSVVVAGERYALHLMPSGILYPGKLAVIANGVVVDPDKLIEELDGLAARGVDVSGLVVSDRAHVVMPYHKVEDGLREEIVGRVDPSRSLGTTKRGIGPCYADKAHRATAVRIGDLVRPDVLSAKLEAIVPIKSAVVRGLRVATGKPADVGDELDAGALLAWAARVGSRLRPHITDTTYLLHDLLGAGGSILFEGANAALLDVDHGTHPFVTSSSTTALGVPAGAGVPGRHLSRIIGVAKSYSTRVGNGPMPTELFDAVGHGIRERGREYGTTTGRPRRVGWLDLVALRYSAAISGATEIALTLLDVLAGAGTLRICTAYELPGGDRTDRFIPDAYAMAGITPNYEDLDGFTEDLSGVRTMAGLPAAARRYIERIESFVGVPVTRVGVGPGREQTIEQR